MIEFTVKQKTLSDAFHDALFFLNNSREREGDVCRECAMTMMVEEPTAEPMLSKFMICSPADLEQYRLEMLDGILDFEVERGNWAYTYHKRMTDCKCVSGFSSDQIRFIINELWNNPHSRRAVVDVRDSSDIYSDDPACLQHIQFMIRDGRLDCFVLFRSNDAVKAAIMNAFALIMLQKKIADALHVPVGTYTHRANSFHAYASDEKRLESFVKRYNAGEDLGIVYDAPDGWKPLMDAEREKIMEKVKKLKERGK